jgi:hypothetical protein
MLSLNVTMGIRFNISAGLSSSGIYALMLFELFFNAWKKHIYHASFSTILVVDPGNVIARV